MSSPIKCPVCGSMLKILSFRHIQSRKHQESLKSKNIGPFDDPTLALVKKKLDSFRSPELTKEKPTPPKIPETSKEPKKPTPPKIPETSKEPKKPTTTPHGLPPIKVEPMKFKPQKKIEHPDPILKPESQDDVSYASEEYMALDIPSIPEPPKKKNNMALNSSELTLDLAPAYQQDAEGITSVLVNCGRCNQVITIPVPQHLVLESELPVVPISYVHDNKNGEDRHCITIHLDHDFDIRRQRLSDVIIQE